MGAEREGTMEMGGIQGIFIRLWHGRAGKTPVRSKGLEMENSLVARSACFALTPVEDA